MIGIDTNVLLRFLVDDDVKQNTLARAFMAERTAEDPAYLVLFRWPRPYGC